MNAKFRWHYISVWSIITMSVPDLGQSSLTNAQNLLIQERELMLNGSGPLEDE